MIERITGNSLSLSAMVKRCVMATLPSVFSAHGDLACCLFGIAMYRRKRHARGRNRHRCQRNGPGLQPRQSVLKSVMIPRSTDIAWNTGNGSKGFVFVTANSRPPVLLATGNEGSRVISWIRRGNYVFELYGDAERRTLLATVTVSGVATEPRNSFSRNRIIARPTTLAAVCRAPGSFVCRALLELDRTGADEISA